MVTVTSYRPGEALKECMQAIRRAHPDYESAQVYAGIRGMAVGRNSGAIT